MTNATFEEGVDRNPSIEEERNAKGKNKKHQKKNPEKEEENAKGEYEQQLKENGNSLTEEKSLDLNKVEVLRGGEESLLPSALAAHYFRQVAAFSVLTLPPICCKKLFQNTSKILAISVFLHLIILKTIFGTDRNFQVSKEQLKALYSVYRLDFKMFGYSHKSYMKLTSA